MFSLKQYFSEGRYILLTWRSLVNIQIDKLFTKQVIYHLDLNEKYKQLRMEINRQGIVKLNLL